MAPNPLGKLHSSWEGAYRLKRPYERPIGELVDGLESLHPSVRRRYRLARPAYSPAKLVEFLQS